MTNLARSYAVESDGCVSMTLEPRVQAILRRMSQVAYVLDQHKQAVARHSRTLAELRSELEALEARA